MSKKLKFYEIKNELFNTSLSLFVGDWKEYNKKMIKLGYKDEGCRVTEGNAGKTWTDDRVIVIYLKSLKNIPVIAHELIHYSTFMKTIKGIPINKDNDEVLAYTVQYMLKQILKLK